MDVTMEKSNEEIMKENNTKIKNTDEPEVFSAKTARLDLGAAFAMVFFQRLFGWLQTGKKLRIVIDYDPQKETTVTISKNQE